MRAQKAILRGPFQNLQHPWPMLPRRRDGAADLTEALDSLLGAHPPRDLLVQLPQAEVSLRLGVVTGHVHLVHTGQPFPLVAFHTVAQMLGWALGDAPSLCGLLFCYNNRRRRGSQPLCPHPVVARGTRGQLFLRPRIEYRETLV